MISGGRKGSGERREGGEVAMRMTLRERTRGQPERSPAALWFNFWRQLKSDADRGKSGINEAGRSCRADVSPTPVPVLAANRP